MVGNFRRSNGSIMGIEIEIIGRVVYVPKLGEGLQFLRFHFETLHTFSGKPSGGNKIILFSTARNNSSGRGVFPDPPSFQTDLFYNFFLLPHLLFCKKICFFLSKFSVTSKKGGKFPIFCADMLRK